MIDEKWNLENIPPKGHKDVAEFAQSLFEIAKTEKERLGKPADFLYNYSLYRGHQGKQQITGRKGSSQQQKGLVPVNLYFSNIGRTIANITARIPTGEVVDMDGIHDDAEQILSMQLKKWWKDTDQQTLTKESGLQQEVYGITTEKPSWNKSERQPAIAVVDPYAFFPAPGLWSGQDISTKCPYVCYAYVEFASAMEKFYDVKDIAPDEAYDLMGSIREDYKSQSHISQQTIGNYVDPMTVKSNEGKTSADKKIERCLIIEVWVRDTNTKEESLSQPLIDDQGQPIKNDMGEPLVATATKTVPVYRDGIRKITITKTKDKDTKSGVMVLDDCDNPNINPVLPTDVAINTYPWGRLPCYYSNSYKDGISVWGFAASEQVGDLIVKINMIVTKLIAYVINVMAPPLIVQQHCGITREMIESSILKAGRLILMPSIPNARIEFMTIPNLPSTFFQVLDLIVKFFDRVYQIEDADRGVGPTGVIAASAIVALQERNQVLMQTKTSAIDSLVECRSRWAIGLWQNHGTHQESVDVAGEAKPFVGVNMAGRKFNFIVESGSMTPRTSLQLREDAKALFEMKAIGQQGLLQTLNWPNWKEEVARTAESQLDQALQILMDAGLPEESAIQIKQMLEQVKFQHDEEKKASQQGNKPIVK
jgi:hypothetical protein